MSDYFSLNKALVKLKSIPTPVVSAFYIEAAESGTITLSKVNNPACGNAKYRINNQELYDTYEYGTPISLNFGDRCYFTITSSSTDFSNSSYLRFSSTMNINAGGKLSSLIGDETVIPRNYCFSNLFSNCSKLINIDNLEFIEDYGDKKYCYYYMFGNSGITSIHNKMLKATTLTEGCYSDMFYACRSITTVPQGFLPATVGARGSYNNMFLNCTGLTTIESGAMSLTTTAINNCVSMFQACRNLTSIPSDLLPATTLGNYCYNSMFYECTSLLSIPAGLLPATNLASGCYYNMFKRCNNLATIPNNLLPATTLASGCYYGMFANCINLSSIPDDFLPATTLASNCYFDMFIGCTELSYFSGNLFKGTNVLSSSYREMFKNCSNIRVSETMTGGYVIPFEIKASGSVGTDGLKDMFVGTGGTFAGTPTENTTYYLWQY